MTRRFVTGLHRFARTLTAGFTLVELMVAVTGGLFVTVAVFVLARQATEVYQSEARSGNATMGSIAGFERLRLDIARAGFLVSPNIQRDPNRCGDPIGSSGSWPVYLQRLQSVFIFQPVAPATQILKDNKIIPNEITLAGSYGSIEQFQTDPIAETTPVVIQLQTQTAPMARLGYPKYTGNAAAQGALLTTVFGAGRSIRIVGQDGREQYGKIGTVTGGDSPTITLTTDGKPPILFRSSSGQALKCGVAGLGETSLVNVVNLVKYSIKDMTKNAAYAPLFAVNNGVTTAAPTTDTGRTELVREELDPDGNTIAGTEEIVAEFAVDLSFGVSYGVRSLDGGQLSQLNTLAPNDTAVASWAGAPPWPVGQGPQLIRAIRARLSVRSREGDRQTGLSAGDGGPAIAPGLYRFGLGAGATAPFARVRTVQADIALRNHTGITWF